MDMMLLKTFSWSKVEISCDLVNFQVSSNQTSFILLFIQFVLPTFPHTLFTKLRNDH